MAPAAPPPPPPPSSAPNLEEVWQDESRRFGLHTVDPEVGAAGVILVAPVQQLEVVRLRVERLTGQKKKKRRFKYYAHFTHLDTPGCDRKEKNKRFNSLLLSAGLRMEIISKELTEKQEEYF